ncbi:hypothetical protein BDW02DRAFT_246703 [Decorospora gaudefroyi]|uniref:Lysine-specific metallo-endopeptidase domain-containing protein n=1 Tax=Decorospora gaudefroyi TaxID=184978 RepID=A0A6A5JXL6_9PLEO|nr:hypothetical protein BDW02DRAFT_246703 [Decorospora gaudefroyi]
MRTQPAAASRHAFSGGELKLDKNHGCSKTQVGQLQTGAWDALALGAFTSSEPNPQNARDVALWKTYIGPDWPSQSKRIADNFGQVVKFLGNKEFDIYLSCSDPSKLCHIEKDGKSIGGCAYEYKGWFGTYYYIAMSAPYFTMQSLDDKIQEIERDLRNGDTKTATRSVWQKNTGQAFLHEMMHLNVVGQPHINDETVEPDATVMCQK